MTVAVIYREALPADVTAMCALGLEVNALHHEAAPHVFAGPGEPERDRAHWAHTFGRPDATAFVAELDGIVVGFVNVHVVVETHSLLQPLCFARVGSIVVTAAQRGRGIGRELMARAEQWARQQDASEIRLNVWAFNRNALRLYEELDYEVRSHNLGKRL
jgi:GNAT superfamily N-acetyltransferase